MTATASGNTSLGFETTAEATYTSSSSSASSGEGDATGPGSPFYGGIGGLPVNATEGGLLYEAVELEEADVAVLGAAYEPGSLYLYDSISGANYHYEVPATALAELDGSTESLGVVGLGELVPLPGSNSAFGFVPSTNGMTAHGLPSEKATALDNLAENNGPTDGVSQTATAPPTSVLVTLAAAAATPPTS